MHAFRRLILILLFFYQINNIYSDILLKIKYETKPPFSHQPFSGSIWSFRISEYEDIRINFFIYNDIDKENGFKILKIVDRHYEEIGYGVYLIKDGIIDYFKVIECKHKVANILTNQKIKLYYTENDILQNHYLLFENSKIKLWGFMNVGRGAERNVGNIPVIIIENNGYTIENAKIRTYPSLGNNTVNYIDDKNNTLNYVPKGTHFYVYARTKNKYQVGKWNNYWFLVKGINCSKPAVDLVQTKYIWIFAEFVKYEEIVDQFGNGTYPTGFPYD